jgi:AcrR family transcriptional regulator
LINKKDYIRDLQIFIYNILFLAVVQINTKDKIAETAFILALKYGFSNVTINQITQKSGIAPGTIYYYFNEKEEILERMIQLYLLKYFERLESSIAVFSGTFHEKLFYIFYSSIGLQFPSDENSYGNIAENNINYKEFFLLFKGVYHQNPEFRHLYHGIHTELLHFYERQIKEAIDNNEIRSDLDENKITTFLLSVLKGFVDLWITLPDMSIGKIINDNVEMIWEAIKIQDTN